MSMLQLTDILFNRLVLSAPAILNYVGDYKITLPEKSVFTFLKILVLILFYDIGTGGDGWLCVKRSGSISISILLIIMAAILDF